MIKELLATLGIILSPPDMAQVCHRDCAISQSGVALIQSWEGYSPYAYKDPVGLLTIGNGHLILPGEKFKEPMLPGEAEALLRKDLKGKEAKINQLVTVPLRQAQYDAIASFTYNVGHGNLARSTLLKRVNQKRHRDVPAEFNKWVYAGKPPKKLRGLEVRRAAEAGLYALPLSD